MEIIISLLMGTRLLTLLGGGVGHEAAAIAFLPPRIILARDEVRISCQLVHAYPEELKKLLKTATPVVIYLFVEFRENGTAVNRITVESAVTFDMIAKSFTVMQSQRGDTLRCASIDSAIGASSSFLNVPLAARSGLKRDAFYSVTAFAVLGKTKVEALNNKEVDLMYFWDFKRPSFRTEKIAGAQLSAPAQ
jgi:hypothetical protein